MEIERFCLKFFARQAKADLDETSFIPIFHDWIRLKTLPGTLIDVADYRHVPEGPGIMLISHEINYAMEHGNGQFGLSAQRKLATGRSHQEGIVDLAKRLALFGSLLESDGRLAGQLKLEGQTFLYQANDRLRAPNSTEAFLALKPDLEAAASQLYQGADITVSRVENDPRDRLSAMVQASGTIDLDALA